LLLAAAFAAVCILAVMPAASAEPAQAAPDGDPSLSVSGRQVLQHGKKSYYYYPCYYKGKCYGVVMYDKKDDKYAKKACYDKYCMKYKYPCDAKGPYMEKPKC